eukprot:CAMPEP_0119465198 /NCGR_PEP_ID=MMETSP1344-20130328/440_1 /TAXON_ID=236787 /ORGANISM="Florenciella parvula, Strain CCMP2471" /LENGTH=173 /DNA_ID=CAMNT_0007497445 /DNA_START=273 /DNA_END=792 /DNA_ORIENTATION=-
MEPTLGRMSSPASATTKPTRVNATSPSEVMLRPSQITTRVVILVNTGTRMVCRCRCRWLWRVVILAVGVALAETYPLAAAAAVASTPDGTTSSASAVWTEPRAMMKAGARLADRHQPVVAEQPCDLGAQRREDDGVHQGQPAEIKHCDLLGAGLAVPITAAGDDGAALDRGAR